MRPILVVAGLPVAVYDALRANSANRFAPNGYLLAKPVQRPGYPKHQAREYLEEIQKYILALREDEPVSIMLAYVNYEEEYSTELFVEEFFPFAIPRPIRAFEPKPELSRQQMNAELKLYMKDLEAEAVELRRRADLVRSRTNVHNVSPLLLPLTNFQSRHHRPFLFALFKNLGHGSDPTAVLDAQIKAFAAQHPRVCPPDDSRSCYSDGNLFFRSPGKARHGFYRHQNGGGHGPKCLLNARCRLGGAYSHSFHYDCIPTRKLASKYDNCHGFPTPPKEKHVNIAPNDFII
jgi:hypothetical protein